tara:strand:+ start:1806 stop:1961 length:156 start_codon:yes stop_codon:yes gene_type:complete
VSVAASNLNHEKEKSFVLEHGQSKNPIEEYYAIKVSSDGNMSIIQIESMHP